MSQKPDVLRTVGQLLTDLDLPNEQYPSNPAELTDAQTELLQLEWSRSRPQETFSAFLKKRLSLWSGLPY